MLMSKKEKLCYYINNNIIYFEYFVIFYMQYCTYTIFYYIKMFDISYRYIYQFRIFQF